MSARKTRLRAISPNDKLIIDDETGLVVGIAPDARTPASRLMVMGTDLTISHEMRDELRQAGVMVADENGDYLANIGHRTGLLVELMSIDGVLGEIAIPTDVNGFVIYNGVVGGAKFLPRLDSPDAAGANSLAIGANASTGAFADKSLALGNKAKTQFVGEIGFGAGKLGIGKQVVMRHAITTSATAYLVGNGENSSTAFALPALAALYIVRARVLVRDGYLNQWAKFERHGVVRVADDQSNAAVLNATTPTGGDFNENLAGCAVSIIAAAGPLFAVQITGLAGRTLNWAVFIEIETFTEEVLL